MCVYYVPCSHRLAVFSVNPVHNVVLLQFIIGLCKFRMTRTCKLRMRVSACSLPAWDVYPVQDVVSPRFECCVYTCMSKVFFDQLKHCDCLRYALPIYFIVYVTNLLMR